MRTPHQQFLRTFTYGFWREYSAIAHSGFEGLMIVGMYYVPDSFIHEDREKLEAQHIGVLSLHVPRAALILLCIVTELQALPIRGGRSTKESTRCGTHYAAL